jgi:DivIVA domain-containing protein
VALDRQTIMRDDFPSNRRGYDPAAVDAHLDRIADEVDDLRRRAAAPAPLSAQAGEQVQAIVEAAERGAQEIREAAQAEAREHVAHVTAAADRLRERIEQMERDLTQLVIDLREGADRLRGDLDALQAGTDALSSARGAAPAAPAPAPVEPPPTEPRAVALTPEPLAAAPEPPAPEPAATAEPKNGDSAAARIVALDMALSGTSREDTDRYLAENYDLPDRAALLDEVYAAAGS